MNGNPCCFPLVSPLVPVLTPCCSGLSGILLCIFRAEAVSKAATSSFMMTFSSLVKIYLFSVLILIATWSKTFEFKLFYSKLQMTRHPHSFITIIKKQLKKILPLVWERRHKLLGEILKEETDRTGSILKARLHVGLDCGLWAICPGAMETTYQLENQAPGWKSPRALYLDSPSTKRIP